MPVLKTQYKERKRITEAEARYIIAHATTSSNDCVVVQHSDGWFDVRGLTKAELAHILADLDREFAAKLASGIERPH
jgi:hypothetical protein